VHAKQYHEQRSGVEGARETKTVLAVCAGWKNNALGRGERGGSIMSDAVLLYFPPQRNGKLSWEGLRAICNINSSVCFSF
jgi:hypothetical protein